MATDDLVATAGASGRRSHDVRIDPSGMSAAS
jgi:hypothetical protein